jgi:hypothetical protein
MQFNQRNLDLPGAANDLGDLNETARALLEGACNEWIARKMTQSPGLSFSLTQRVAPTYSGALFREARVARASVSPHGKQDHGTP